MYSFSWLHLPTFITQTTIVSEKIHCFTFFSVQKHGPNLSLPWNRSRSSQVALEYPMQHTNFPGHPPFGSREDDFLSFYHIWTWRPSWSCDLDRLIKLSFPYPMEARHKIWLQLAMQFLRKRNLKMLNLSDLGPRSMNGLPLPLER